MSDSPEIDVRVECPRCSATNTILTVDRVANGRVCCSSCGHSLGLWGDIVARNDDGRMNQPA